MGIGRHVDIADISQGLLQARSALSSARNPAPAVIHFESGLISGPQSLMSPDGLKEWAESALAPLLALPREERTRLLTSLSVYLTHNGRWASAADSLGIHPHSLRYRMRQVEDRLEISLDSARTRAHLWLALEILPPTPPTVTGFVD